MTTLDDTLDVSFLDFNVDEVVAEEVGIDRNRARRVCKLFEEGCEVAYIARYRGQTTQNMSADEVRKTFEAFTQARELEKKVVKAAQTVTEKLEGAELQIALTKLNQAREPADVSEVTRGLTVRKKSKAAKARELGVEDAAVKIFAGETVDLRKYVDGKELKSLSEVEKQVSVLLAEMIHTQAETTEVIKRISSLQTRTFMTVHSKLTNKFKQIKEKEPENAQIRHFQDYVDVSKNAYQIQDYQVLAMCRGEEKEVLTWKVELKNERMENEHPLRVRRVAREHQNLYHSALSDSINKLFIPKLQRAAKRFLTKRAEQAAIDCFTRNLGQLFSQAPLPGKYIAALDPGFSACKAAFLSPSGQVLDSCEFRLKGKEFDAGGVATLKKWCGQVEKNSLLVIAIGNGKASTETQHAVGKLISLGAFRPIQTQFCVVPENGASKYSITPLAEQELPDMPCTQRSAVSIGRRLIDPVAEFVKIEPKHLGMGMYQHSVSEKRLESALAIAVRDWVSLRGVDVNTASLQLLQHVCGLNKQSAMGVIALRDKLGGRIRCREQLKLAKGVGEKKYEQCAGFLVINNSDAQDCQDDCEEPVKKKRKTKKSDADEAMRDPLDATTVHPLQYPVAKGLLKRLGISVRDVLAPSGKEILRKATNLTSEEEEVRNLLCSEYKLIDPPPLQTEIRSVTSLRPGERLWGRVLNQVDFGLFIDIGAEKNGLAHRSVLPQPQPQVGTSLQVEIVSIDNSRGRITLKPCN